jgi:hypothetical protein
MQAKQRHWDMVMDGIPVYGLRDKSISHLHVPHFL